MPRGHSLSIYAHFSGKKRTSMYIYREKGDRYYIQRRHKKNLKNKTLCERIFGRGRTTGRIL